jgi:hypothetical protein
VNIGEFYQLIRQCGCGSGLLSTWCKNEKGTDLKACDRCKPQLLRRIFASLELNERELDDLLKEKGCEKVCLSSAQIRQKQDHVLISFPNGKLDYVLVPKSYAEEVLKAGKII